MIYPPVLTKADFVVRFGKSEFGNRLKTWLTIEDWCNSGQWEGLFHLRNRVPGGVTHYNTPHYEILDLWRSKSNPNLWYVSQMAPTELTTFQGEVYRSELGLALYYSCLPLTMREGLAKDGRMVYGVVAKTMLDYFLDPSSLDWLYELLNRYEDHVVEFSCYDKYVGTVPNRNTIIWEVRHCVNGY